METAAGFSFTDVDVTEKNAVSGVYASHGAVTVSASFLQVNKKVFIVLKETVKRLTCSAFKVNSVQPLLHLCLHQQKRALLTPQLAPCCQHTVSQVL